MQRITITIDDDLLAALDGYMQRKGYDSRSEAIRDLTREAMAREGGAGAEDAPCVAAFSYVYDHEKRELAQRLVAAQHDHHDLPVATLHVHLDHHACLEVSVLRGAAGDVRRLADEIATQRGVRYAQLHLIPATLGADDHHHHSQGSAGHHHHIKV